MIWLDHYFSTQVLSITSRRHKLNPALSGWLWFRSLFHPLCHSMSPVTWNWLLPVMLSAPWIILNFNESWMWRPFKSTHKDHVTKQCKLFEANPDPILQIYPEPNRDPLKQSNSGEDWNKLRCLSCSSDCTNTNKQTRTSTINIEQRPSDKIRLPKVE